MKEERFPHTRKPLHWLRRGMAGGKLRSHGGERSNREAEGKAERFRTEDRCQPALTSLRGLSAHPLARTSGGWELRLRLRRSDPRERTGVGCVNTA